MKILLFTCKWAVLFLILSGWLNPAQSQPKIEPKEAGAFLEKTILISDRETYCVDEDILFSAFNASSSDLYFADWSNVLYVELVSPDGEALVSKKFAYGREGTSGSLRIPNTVLTGNYYLRAYTRWMRNYSPYHFFYKMIKVINPFRAELLEPSGKVVLVESEVKLPWENSPDLQINVGRNSVKAREELRLEVMVTNPSEYSGLFSVSVIPKGTEIQLVPELQATRGLHFSSDLIPETRGLSISGQVLNSADSLPLSYILVGLTIFKDDPEIRNIMTNEEGKFFFDLSTLEGEYDVFISANSKENQTPLILVDNDFSTQAVSLPFVAIDLSEAPRHLYQRLMFNSQAENLFRSPVLEEKVETFKSDSAFYGTPEITRRLADYISMPTIRDYFFELIPQVGIRKDGKKTRFRVLGDYSDLAVYDPLVLVDMVPIFDIDQVLALAPSKIDRIEVVNKPYIRGDIIFGGIISLFSRNKDLAGINLPSTGRFITYNMLNPAFSQVVPDLKNQRIPNLQNCLYWNPKLKLTGSEPVDITFNAGDGVGDYIAVLRGVDRNGKIKVATTAISVK